MTAIKTTSISLAPEAQRLALGNGEAHVWMLADGPSDPAHHLAVLDSNELARAAHFQFEEHRREYIAAHWLLRVALSHYDGRPPAAWRFITEPDGRPIITGDPDKSGGLRFSLSHAAGRALVAVTREAAVGVDLEGDASLSRMAEIAERSLTPRELALWKQESDAQASARFALQRWTLKEAYAKGRGLGLKLDFAQFGFTDSGGAWRLDELPADDPRPHDWRFFSFAPWPAACAALAVLSRGSRAIKWRLLAVSG
jgi:4'-phosphopantetheinyl transferase